MLSAAAVGVVAAMQLRPCAADVSATWQTETSSDWSDTSQWSGAVEPNNGNGGLDYLAFIDATGGTSYTVGLSTNVTIDGLTIDSADATLSQTGDTFQAGSIDIDAGAYQIGGAGSTPSLSNTTVTQNGGTFSVTAGMSAILGNVTVNGGDLQVGSGSALYVQNSVTIGNQNLDLGYGAALYFDSPSPSPDNLNITAVGGLSYVYASGPDSGGGQTITLGGNVTVHGGVNFLNYAIGDALVNNGTINADGGHTTGIYINSFTNNATAEATNGGTLLLYSPNWANAAAGTITGNASTVNLAGNWSNAGNMTAVNAATFNLGGNFTTAGIGSFTASADSTVNITGSLNNGNATLAPGAHGGTWTLGSGGAITGGTVDLTNGNFSVGQYQGGTLNGVTISNGDLVVGFDGGLFVKNGLTITNQHLDLANNTDVYFDSPNQTFDNVTVTGVAASSLVVGGPDVPGDTQLTLGPGFVADSGVSFADSDFNLNFTHDTLINNGTINGGTRINTTYFTNNHIIDANGAGVNIGGYSSIWTNSATGTISGNASTVNLNGAWINYGNITATNGAVFNLNIGGNFTTADIGSFTASANCTVNLGGGVLNNTGATFKPANYGGNWILTGDYPGATITGGTIDNTGGEFSVELGTLDGVAVTGSDLNVDDNGGLNIVNGITVADGNLNLGRNAALAISGINQTIDNLNITSITLAIIQPLSDLSGDTNLTLGGNVTVNGAVNFSNNSGNAITNDGQININNSAYGTSFNTTFFTNNNLIQISDGASLTINSRNFVNHGTLAVLNGTLYAPNGLDIGDGKLIGAGTVSGNVTVSSGGKISPGTSTALGTGATDTFATLTTGPQTWNGGGACFWKISAPGTPNVTPATGGSGALGGGTGNEGTDWDQLVTTGLTINSGGNNTSFTITADTPTPLNSVGGAVYSWIIARTGSTSLPTFTGATNPYTAGANLLAYSPTGAGNDAFVLDPSDFATNTATAPPASAFTLEFASIANDGGDYDLVLDYYSPTPEPTTAMLALAGGVPLLAPRRRRRSQRP